MALHDRPTPFFYAHTARIPIIYRATRRSFPPTKSSTSFNNRTMSSGFVSGGTTDAPIERSNEWLVAQKELDANRQRKAEQARQGDGRSLFEALEANKGTTIMAILLLRMASNIGLITQGCFERTSRQTGSIRRSQ